AEIGVFLQSRSDGIGRHNIVILVYAGNFMKASEFDKKFDDGEDILSNGTLRKSSGKAWLTSGY
ncbi:hypothetical protein DS2_08323, partial [Catenovulum agarivorans DS-2]